MTSTPSPTAGAPRARRTRRSPEGKPVATRRRWVRRVLWTLLTLFLLGVGAIGVAFATIDPPSPNALADAQSSIVYYDDGQTELGRIAELDRESVPLSRVPKHVQQAVLAAEDREFYSNNGISPTGIARSVWQALQGADVQGGGSTITQQYVKNYFLTQDRTLDRKLREMVISIKLDRDQSKDQILEGYLNTIYYGRGAYGIQTASKAYFNKSVEQLTVAEGAVLASVINAPSLFDPALGDKQRTNLTNRFGYVLDGMVSQGWLNAADRAAATLPQVLPKAPSRVLAGPNGYLMAAVRKELTGSLKLTAEDVDRGGLRITTTINKKAQDAAVAAVDKNFPTTGRLDGVYAGLAAVRPGDGAVVAMYGGKDYQTRQFSSATDARIPAGSTFKAFTLIAALQQQISTKSLWDANGPLRDPALGTAVVNNYGNRSFGTVDLRRATAVSANTAYVRLNLRVGPQATMDAAIAAGLPPTTVGLDALPLNVLGTAAPTVLDVANSYATIAAEGKRATPYLIAKVTSATIDVSYTAAPKTQDAFSREVAADAIDALRGVTSEGGTAARAANLGRPVAGKTGTSEDVHSVWFSGFVPQLSTAVAMYKDVDGVQQPLENIGGQAQVASSSYPLSIWLDFMSAALDGVQQRDFPPRAGIGDGALQSTPVAPPAPATTSSAAPTTTTTAPPTTVPEPTTSTPPAPPTTTEPPVPTTSAPRPTTGPTRTTGGPGVPPTANVTATRPTASAPAG